MQIVLIIALALALAFAISSCKGWQEQDSENDIDHHDTLAVNPMAIDENHCEILQLNFLISARNIGRLNKNDETDNDLMTIAYVEYESKAFGLTRDKTGIWSGSLNPEWSKIFSFPWKKGTAQMITFEVRVYPDDELLGMTQINADDYMENGQYKELPLKGGSAGKNARLIIEKTTPIQFTVQSRNKFVYLENYWRNGLNGRDVGFVEVFSDDIEEMMNWQFPRYEAHFEQGKDLYWHFAVFEDKNQKKDFIGQVFIRMDAILKNNEPTYNTTVPLAKYDGYLQVTSIIIRPSPASTLKCHDSSATSTPTFIEFNISYKYK